MDDLVKDVDSLNKYDSLSYITSSEYRFIVEQNAQINGARENGLKEGKKEVASNLKKHGMSIEEIVELTGLSKEEIESL